MFGDFEAKRFGWRCNWIDQTIKKEGKRGKEERKIV
jgi:hypothetical protein